MIGSWFNLRYTYRNLVEQRRANILLRLNLIALAMWLIQLIVNVIPTLMQNEPLPTPLTIFMIGMPIFALLSYQLLQRGHLQWVIWGAIIFATGISISAGIETLQQNLIAVVIPVVLAGLLLDRRGLIVITLVMFGSLVIAGLNDLEVTRLTVIPRDEVSIRLLVSALTLGFIALALAVFNQNDQRLRQQTLIAYQQFQALNEYLSEYEGIEHENDFYLQTLRIVQNKLGYDFAQIYRVNAQGEIVARLSTSLGQESLIVTENTQLPDNSLIETVVREGRIIQVDADIDKLDRRHLLPAVQTALSLPIVAGERVIAVLDVQSYRANTFDDSGTASVLKALVSRLGVHLTYHRELQNLHEDLEEQARLVSSQQAQLERFTANQQTNPVDDWQTYTAQQHGKAVMGFDVSDVDDTLQYANDPLDMNHPDLRRGGIVIETHQGKPTICIPIMLQGELIGAMSFDLPPRTNVSPRTRDLLQGITRRLALALENRRLWEQTRSQAEREAQANEIGGMLLRSTDVRTVLQLAADQFNQALGAVNTQIHLQPKSSKAQPQVLPDVEKEPSS